MIKETAKPISTAYLLVALFTLVILIAPILLVDYLPFCDFPNHVARSYVRANYDRVPLLHDTYFSQWTLSPYLAMDLIAVPLGHIMNAYWAARLFLILLVLSFCAGCYLLSATIQHRFTWIAPISCFLVYNSTMLWGFVNYMFGLSMFMLVFAGWLRWRERWTPLKILALAVLAIFCYLCHLVSYMLLGMGIGLVSLWDLWKRRISLWTAILSIVPAMLPIGIFLFYAYMQAGGSQVAIAHNSGMWNSLRGKVAEGLIMFRGYRTYEDACIALAWTALLLLVVFKRRSVWVYQAGAVLGVVFFAMFLAFPRTIAANGDGDGFDGRFVLPAVLLLLFSIRLVPEEKFGRTILVAALALSVFRVGLLTYEWHSLSNTIESATQLFKLMPEGARVYPASYRRSGTDEEKTDVALSHILCYAIIDRQIANPLLYQVGGLISWRKPPVFSLWRQGQDLSVFDSYQYVWGYSEPPELRALLSRSAVIVGERDGFTLWKLPNPPTLTPAVLRR